MTGQQAKRAKGTLMLAAAVAVFIVCSIVQASGDSSMFSTTYPDPESAAKEMLMNITFWPGWLVTVGLLIGGVINLLGTD